MICPACKAAPKLKGRACAFFGRRFDSEYWMCGTLGLLRDAAIWSHRDDQHNESIAIVPMPEHQDLQGYLVLTFYKDRGRVSGALYVSGGRTVKLTLRVAETALSRAK